jgi:hypothetical protein
VQRTWPGEANGVLALKLLLFAVLAVHFSYNDLKVNDIFLNTQQYVAGFERSPYQYRVLMMPVFSALLHFFNNLSPAVMAFKRPIFLHSPEQLCYFFVSAACYFGAVLLFDRLSRRLFSRSVALLCLSIFVLITYLFFDLNPVLSFLLPYDMSALLFSNALLLLFLDRRWVWTCLLFILATINRETTFVMIFVVLANAVFTRDLADRKASLIAAGVMGVLWLVIKLALTLLMTHARPDEGTIHGLANIRIPYNLSELLKPWDWPAVIAVYIPAAMAAYLFVKSKQAGVRGWTSACLAAFLAFFALANTTEQRAFGDVIGLYAIVCTLFILRTVLAVSDSDLRLALDRRAGL